MKPTKFINEVTLKKVKTNLPFLNYQIKTSKDAADFLVEYVYDLDTLELFECAHVLLLNRANRIINYAKISEGGISSTVIDPKKVFQFAFLSNASGIIISHSHPSGQRKPSEADIKLTAKIKEAGNFLDLPLMDHIIICPGNDHYSFADEGRL